MLKLSPLAETIHKQLAVENSIAAQELRTVELEKQVSTLMESLDMAENYRRHLNIRIVGLAEDTETGQPVEFFKLWLPRVLKLAIRRANHALAPKPDPNRSPMSLLLRFHNFRDK